MATDLVVRAGAGTGKTWTLVEVFVHLVAGTSALSRRVRPGRILALTFGDKAATELGERVRARAMALAQAPAADATLNAAYAERAMPPLGSSEWRAVCAELTAAPISTFHAFAASILRRHAAAAGLDPGFLLLDEERAAELRRQAHEQVVLAQIDRPEIGALVRELEYGGDGGRGLLGALVALATRLAEDGRAAPELADHLDDGAAAAAAHTAARSRWLEAYDGLLSLLEARRRPTPAEGRALAELRARRTWVHGFLGGLDPDADASAEPTLAQALGVCARLRSDEVRERQSELRDASAALAQAFAGRRAAALTPALVSLLSAAESAYAEAKRRRGALDFADLMTMARALLASSAAARAETQARFDAMLVDEFQDTNLVQKALLDACRAPGVPRLVVGDPKQSIYEFRGADVSVFGLVEAETRALGGQVLALTESRRGRRGLVDFVNELFTQTMRGGEHPFELRFDPAADALSALRGDAADGPLVHTLTIEKRADEPARVAELVAELRGIPLAWDKHHEAAGPRPARWGDIAVLLRRFTRLDEYLAELRRRQVPHYVVNGRGFHEAQEIRDLGHALALLDDPDDAVSLLGVLRSPLVGLADRSLVALAALAPGRGGRPGPLSLRPILAARELPAELTSAEACRLGEFRALWPRLWRHADRLGVGGTLAALVDATELRAVLAAAPYGEQRLANLEQLLAEARAHDQRGETRAGFSRRLRAQLEREDSRAAPAQVVGEDDDVVRLMTVHQAKGLEFPIVVVPECGASERSDSAQVVYDRSAGLGLRVRRADGDSVPSPRAAQALELRRARAEAERQRLFYVACTRARDALILTGAALPRAVTSTSQIDFAARRSAAAPPPEPEAPAAAAQAPAAQAPAALIDGLAARLGPPRTGAQVITAPVTELADFAACARRYRLRHELGLEEHPLAEGADRRVPAPRRLPVVPAPPPEPEAQAAVAVDDLVGADPALDPALDPGALDALARGTLAHRLLERIDLGAWHAAAHGDPAAADALLDATLAREGYAAPHAPDVAAVRTTVGAFLAGRFGRSLAARPAKSLAREESFVFAPLEAPGGARLQLKGQMDLVLFDDGGVTVLDYKLARSTSRANYRFQLMAYAAAARALWERPVRVGLVYLLDADPQPTLVTPTDAELDATCATLAELAARLAESRRVGAFPGLAPPSCRALACGFHARCHAPMTTPAPPAPAGPGRRRSARGQLRLGEGVEGW
jgi:ATP-dependent exoDNAse (exonuclease V) beta subunit